MNIIPKPDKIIHRDGYFNFREYFSLNFLQKDKTISSIVEQFREAIMSFTDLDLKINSELECGNPIIFNLEETELGPEGYVIEITSDQIKITSKWYAGLFYGTKTLQQILFQVRSSEGKDIRISCCKIIDKPRFVWRGMHLDVSRHFFDKQFIKRYLDLLALHKLNRFHWHLTDDNGWRIEIKKYPLLTKKSAWRKNLEHLSWNERDKSKESGNGLYGGFYTQDDIREIVEYAQKRFIEVIPEIEMPGHSREVFAAYPQFSCRGKKLAVSPGGYWPNIDIFCAGNDESFGFLQDILDEIIELFPSKYIHIGGDEADKTLWKECSKCQNRIKEEDLSGENELQSWFIMKISDYVRQKGKKIIGWDEILEGDLKADAVIMCWRGDGTDAASLAALKGLKMIMCPNHYLYFDWKQSTDNNEQGAFGVTTLEKVYNYDPLPCDQKKESTALVLGAQGNVWTEWMTCGNEVEYMALPRLSALAEVVWSVELNKDYQNFRSRFAEFSYYLDFLNYNYKKP